jgi:hypothetical protein
LWLITGEYLEFRGINYTYLQFGHLVEGLDSEYRTIETRPLLSPRWPISRLQSSCSGTIRKATALDGLLSETQRWQLDEIARLDQAIGRIETKLEELYRPFDRQLERLRTILGVHV